jgi:excinuclease UvrABC nuclease subunit
MSGQQISSDAGVYAFFDKEQMVYVVESGSLRGRLNDLRRTVNHTLRKSIGEKRCSVIEGYVKATSKKKFPNHIEELVNIYICSLQVSIVPVSLGRTEIEEYLINKYKPIFNSKTRRGQ